MSDLLNNMTGTSSYIQDSYSAKTSALEGALKNTDYSKATDEELMEACKSFEQYMIEQAMKGMEKMVPKSKEESHDNSYVDMFKDKLYEEYAEITANQASGHGENTGIGIARQLFEQMKRNYASVTPEQAAAARTESDTEE